MTTVIAIDAGHPSHVGDEGCVRGNSWDRIVEHEYTLEIAQILFERLASLPGVQPAMLRENGTAISLEGRAALAKQLHSELVLSLHVNISPDPHVRGLMPFYWPSVSIARDVANAISHAAPAPFRRRGAPIYALTPAAWKENARAVVAPHLPTPCVLVELFHASNAADRRAGLLLTGKRGLALACEAGVLEFLRQKEERPNGV